MEQNRRAARRSDAFRIGSLALDVGTSAIDCLVWNQSETGAQIEVESPAAVPDQFTLMMSAYAKPRRCHVVWRDGRKLGITFVI
ncbi:pilus assembly protein PilZ [Methylobacterium sp. Leaf113]|uniref:pilus assembly protein PilZ n=1 Tax=unclassified Methylobacterium TaxID=2615210 RepID=UPI0006FBAC9B|nr:MULTISPECIES: pilus assembly protein PilZ [unclassified Methylobacterium]KQP91055.1 pilus assembly protein PilZ [Methylobacterium sp. Leaf113]KQP91982.1 pilus assembly protein PilZ [Methylobacterium sp. Leaf117]